jgi:hypothetical protein
MKTGIMVQPTNDSDIENQDNLVTADDEHPTGTVEVDPPPKEEEDPPKQETEEKETEEHETKSEAPAPFQPYGLTCPDVSTDGAWLLEWLPAENATRYSVRESANGGDWRIVYQGTDTKFPVKGKPVGSYSYSVTAWNNIGKSSPPSEVATCRVIVAPKMERAIDTEDLVRVILTDGSAYLHPTAFDDWVKNNIAKMSDEGDVLRILALSGGTNSLVGA